MARTAGDNKHLESLSSARYLHVVASQTNLAVRTTEGRLLRVILNTNGGTVTLKNGAAEVIGIIASDAPEGTFNYGIWCRNGIYVDTGATTDCTVVFSD